MPIFVDQEPTATPNPTALAKQIELQNTLRSTLDTEQVQVAYLLPQDRNIWFRDENGQLQKKIVVDLTVGSAPQVCTERLTLVAGPGPQEQLLTVEVQLAIRDSQGNVIPGLCVVQFEP